jgi:hypothetical protein
MAKIVAKGSLLMPVMLLKSLSTFLGGMGSPPIAFMAYV